MTVLPILRIFLIFAFLTSTVKADGDHGGGSPVKPRNVFSPAPPSTNTTDSRERDVNGSLVAVKIVDGFEISMKVADVKDSISDGGSHNILIKIKRDDKIQRGVVVNANVLFPDKSQKSKSFMELGDWYLAGYDLGSNAKHEIMLTFKSTDGDKHNVQFVYP